jgi:hypothetical protein
VPGAKNEDFTVRVTPGLARAATVVAIVLAALAASACRPSSPLRITTIQTGRSLNSDNSVGNHTTRFKPDDTIYVAVLNEGRGSGSIGVRWKYAGRLVSEETREVSYVDSAATQFHITNSGGFPAGDYSVEILVDGTSYATRSLTVQR